METLSEVSLQRAAAGSEHLGTYLREIERYPLLSLDEEAGLLQKAWLGDKEARQELITANLRFVIQVAGEYRGCGLAFADLIAEGNVGLVKALDRFDPSRRYRLITYAAWWIRQTILEALYRQERIVRQPRSQVRLRHKMKRDRDLLSQQLGRSPHTGDMARFAEVDPEQIDEALGMDRRDGPYDEVDNPDKHYGPTDWHSCRSEVKRRGPDELMDEKEAHTLLAQSLRALPGRDAWVVCSYFGLEGRSSMTLEQIGKTLGITRERVRQIRNSSLEKIRVRLGAYILAPACN